MSAEFLPRAWAVAAGFPVVVISLVLFGWAVITMHREGASIPTGEPTDAIVANGPYRLSRNPIYLSMVILLLGIGLWANSGWFIVLAVLAIAFLTWGVIVREERYLGRKFGDSYYTYKKQVRRWL
jgi:protein-S-isoprenylcysteine O-methyltransferase Ste14